jgi:hypothetical protein
MTSADQTNLLEILEAVYWDTVIPVAAQLQDAGVDLLNLQIDSDATSYWEPHLPYSSLNSQR